MSLPSRLSNKNMLIVSNSSSVPGTESFLCLPKNRILMYTIFYVISSFEVPACMYVANILQLLSFINQDDGLAS